MKYVPLLIAIWLFVIACGLLSSPVIKATPTPVFGSASLWPDVPVFPNAVPGPEADFLNQFSQMNSGMMPMIFYTDQQAGEVAAFYSDDMMKGQGWAPDPYAVVKLFSASGDAGPQTHTNYTSGGCQTGAHHGQQVAYCTFTKTDDQGQTINLVITVAPDQKNSGQTMITYVRETAPNSNSDQGTITPMP